jgi:hypothetical protein
LREAIKWYETDIVKLLIKHGADPHLYRDGGPSNLELTARTRRMTTVLYLLNIGTDVGPIGGWQGLASMVISEIYNKKMPPITPNRLVDVPEMLDVARKHGTDLNTALERQMSMPCTRPSELTTSPL